MWTSAELAAQRWQAPCLAWSGDSKLVVAVASRFRSTADVFARLSDLGVWPSIRYWSVSRQAWRPLVLGMAGIDAQGQPVGGHATLALKLNSMTLINERDENSGQATYRFRVVERDDAHVLITTENAAPITLAIITAFDPGSLQTATFVRREGSDIWSTYQITRVGTGGSSLVLGHKGSFLNRLEAVRRYLAGQPTDRMDPIARH